MMFLRKCAFPFGAFKRGLFLWGNLAVSNQRSQAKGPNLDVGFGSVQDIGGVQRLGDFSRWYFEKLEKTSNQYGKILTNPTKKAYLPIDIYRWMVDFEWYTCW